MSEDHIIIREIRPEDNPQIEAVIKGCFPEFQIPLKVDISTDSILKIRGTDAISSLISSLLKKEIKVQYKGDLIYKTFGFSYTYAIDETEMVKIDY